MESMTDWAFSCPISVSVLDNGCGLIAGLTSDEGRRTLVVLHHVSQMVASRVVRLAHTHRVVRKVDIAVVTCCMKVSVSSVVAWLKGTGMGFRDVRGVLDVAGTKPLESHSPIIA